MSPPPETKRRRSLSPQGVEDTGPLRVLVVDDDPELRRLIEPSVRAVDPEAGIDWSPALGQAAFHMGLSEYDVVLVDWRLGAGQSGLEIEPLMQRFQPRARFAVMTGASRSEFERDNGPCNLPFLPKPFTTAEGEAFLAALVRDGRSFGRPPA